MLVRECYTEPMRDENGLPLLDREGSPICIMRERMVEHPGCITEAEALAGEALADELEAEYRAQQSIRERIAEIEREAVAAFMDDDTARVDALKAERAALRAKLAG